MSDQNLWRCSRRKCGWIGHKDQWQEVPHPDFKGEPRVTKLVCPRCGGDSFYKAKPGEVARPTVVCLCGSTRFMDAFQEANLIETLAGKIVLSIGCNTKSDVDLLAMGQLTPEVKARLDELHKRKIDIADEVLVLNIDGYVGSSTRSEIEYAIAKKKKVRWLEAPAA